ncbi:MAG: hypothetical protein U5L09_15835 [Bacteroidales bacterium]|nr:hypothetical protein [Bacteroidales bacterium]
MTRDNNKGISVDYNYLNLPRQITFDSGDKIHYLTPQKDRNCKSVSWNRQAAEQDRNILAGGFMSTGHLKEVAP